MQSRYVTAAIGLMLAGATALGYAESPAGSAAPLTAAQERALTAKDTFQECGNCPEMVVVPAGSFTMGSPATDDDADDRESPQHVVTIRQSFAVGKWHVTVDQFGAFVRETSYEASPKCHTLDAKGEERTDRSWRNPGFVQQGSHPVVCVTWNDAKAYVDWLAKKTGKRYRLLSEAEWEYAARGRTTPGDYPRFWFGDDEKDLCRNGNGADQAAIRALDAVPRLTFAPCNDGYVYTSPAGHYAPNAFGLYDMAGNAWQWTEDCYHIEGYAGAPDDGSAWIAGGCMRSSSNDGNPGLRVVRGGSWGDGPKSLRAAQRSGFDVGSAFFGFRVARTLTY
jgi:formylglycine-generating enzyme required for sulfatase activity